MNYLVISSHPYSESFNVGVAENVAEVLKEKGEQVSVIDLVSDGFDPVMSSDDLMKWRTGGINDPLVIEYMKKIDEADVLVFPFPLWWGHMPAILKGFCDKVLQVGFAYKYDENGNMVGLLNDKKAVVITTMQMTNEVYDGYLQNPIIGSFIKDTLQVCGIDVAKHFQIETIVSGGKEYTDEKMNEIKTYFKEM